MPVDNYLILTPEHNIEAYFTNIEKIYVSNGWGKAYPKEILKRMFHNTYYLIAVSKSGAVGFLRAFTDGVVVTHLSEIVVDPVFHGRGIGGVLIRKFLEDVAHTTIYAEALNMEAGIFLQRYGFGERQQLRVYARRKEIEG